jgi:hypothetical protein
MFTQNVIFAITSDGENKFNVSESDLEGDDQTNVPLVNLEYASNDALDANREPTNAHNENKAVQLDGGETNTNVEAIILIIAFSSLASSTSALLLRVACSWLEEGRRACDVRNIVGEADLDFTWEGGFLLPCCDVVDRVGDSVRAWGGGVAWVFLCDALPLRLAYFDACRDTRAPTGRFQ